MKYLEVSPTLSKWEAVKMSGPLVVFSIALPLVDIITDLRTIVRLYILGNTFFASMFLGLGFLNKQDEIF